MKKFLLSIAFLFLIPINAQELNEQQLDSLYNTFLRIRVLSDIQPNQTETKPEVVKCGFGIVNEIKLNLERYSIEKQQLLKSLLQRPTKQTSMLSPSGFFRIHYNTTGTEVPSYNPSLTTEENVMQVGIALDSSYNFEVNFLGYPQPPPDDAGGGDNLYDVYISNLGGVYGFTERETNLGNQKYTSFIVIDDNYSGFPSTGFAGMRVTIAHEFHHAIQMGSYIFRNEDIFFYEITSTSMEEFVYDDVNDYYFYMSNYFNDPGKPFASFRSGTADGYDLAIWNIYLKDKFGFEIIKRQWELLPQMRALNAISSSLNLPEYGSNFREAFNEFGVWTFFTDRRAKQSEYFEEAENYPLIKPISSLIFDPPDETVTVNSKPTVNSFISFINSNTNPDDTLTALVTNADYTNGISNPNTDFPFEYKLFNYPAPGSRRLNENFNYYALFNVDQPSFWSNSEFLNSDLIGQSKFTAEYDYAFPSPFRYTLNTFIFIPVSSPESDEVDLTIYTPSMDRVYSIRQVLTRQDNQPGVRWNVLNNEGEKLASGVYIYAIKSGDKTSKGKLVIFNE